jgi:hypothetical protein
VEFAFAPSGDLKITLRNTGTGSNYGSSQVLTGISFQTVGADFIAGSGTHSNVVVGPNSTLSCANGTFNRKTRTWSYSYSDYPDPADSDIDVSTEWGLAYSAILDVHDGSSVSRKKFNLTGAATTPVAGLAPSQFADGDYSSGNGSLGLGGADFGLINAASRMNTGLNGMSLIMDSVVITLQSASSVPPNTVQITDAAFLYGSSTTGGVVAVADDLRVVPEPACIAVWSLLGLCWAGMSFWQQRRAASRGPSWNRGRNTRSSVRPPWPEDVREAILEIIDRGCHHR